MEWGVGMWEEEVTDASSGEVAAWPARWKEGEVER